MVHRLSKAKRASAWLLAIWFVLLSVGCDRRSEPTPEKPAVTVAAKADQRPPPTAAFKRPAAERIVAVGDLHGDLDATRRALRLAGALGEGDRWVGGKLVVVQTGDQIDRGDDDRAVLDLLDDVAEQARKAGGALYALNGNHETMNISGDFRYVSERSAEGFSEFESSDPRVQSFPESLRGRAAAFMPGGPYARRLARRPVVIQVQKSVFAHGGVLLKHVRYGLDRINAEVTRWANGKDKTPPRATLDQDSVVWTRRYGSADEQQVDCREVAEVLGALKAERLVVGHTVQNKGISPACEGRVWRIDVGLSSYYGKHPAQVLEIARERVGVLIEGQVAPADPLPATERAATQ